MAEDLMDKVFSFFSGDDPNETDDRKVLLRQTEKELGQNKYAKFFKAKTGETDPSLAVFFYNIYKTTFSIRTFMQNEEKMAQLKQIVLEAFMDNAILDTVKRLNAASVDARAKTTAPAELVTQIKTDYGRLASAFDGTRINGANHCYNLIVALAQLVKFNYPGLLKKFDPNFVGGNFTVEHKFSPVRLEFIAKDLGEFLIASHAMNPEGDWNSLLTLLKSCAGDALVAPEAFTAIVSSLRDLHHSKMLDLMVQFGLGNPVWQWKPQTPDEKIGEEWLEARKREAQKCIEKITSAQKHGQINALTRQIFETADLVRLENYNTVKGEAYRNRNLEYYVYAEGLNYLKIFLDEYLDKEFRELCDILLIRGQWTNNSMSKDMSEAIHQLVEASAPIDELDESLSDEGSDGARLKAAFMRVDRDKTQVRYINTIISNDNEVALEIINTAAKNFIVIGKNLKSLIDDIEKKHPELLLNWKELIAVSKEPLAQRMKDDYKRINYFVQLMRLCTV